MKAKSLIGCLLALAIFGCIKFCGDNGVELNGSKTVVRTVKEKIYYDKSEEETDNAAGERNKTAKQKNERLIEIPAKLRGTPERFLKRMAYTLSFNRETNQPNWVAWCLEDSETDGGVGRRNEFICDEDVPLPHRVAPEDYSHSGYDRGHMAPAADMKFDAQAMKECFYMSNICPQTHELNAGVWSKLEKACRRWANKFGKVYIVCGPIFYKNKHKSIGKNLVIPVPDAFFKCIYGVNNGKPQAIGFIMRNNDSKQSMNASAMTVDEVENITGMDFFPNLPDKIENKVESEMSIKNWQ